MDGNSGMKKILIYNKSKIFILAPANTSTGGPECLHELGYHLKNIFNKNCYMFYLPKDIKNPVHKNYLHFKLQFSNYIDDHVIQMAQSSLEDLLNTNDLTGKTFLDVGCGSGLFSLAASNMGANVFSFDFDLDSVECAKEIRRRYAQDHSNWEIQQGSILDTGYLNGLKKFDIVYSWGVIHHTGDLWKAFSNLIGLVNCDGVVCVAIYNDQGIKSKIWNAIKKFYTLKFL